MTYSYGLCDESRSPGSIRGLVLKGNRIVMPASLQPETLVKLHESHQRIEKMRLRARSCVYGQGYYNMVAPKERLRVINEEKYGQ